MRLSGFMANRDGSEPTLMQRQNNRSLPSFSNADLENYEMINDNSVQLLEASSDAVQPFSRRQSIGEGLTLQKNAPEIKAARKRAKLSSF